MRLHKLYIEKYKNLEQFTIDFSDSYHITVLLGKNGSGKSNLFEFISIIFKVFDLGISPVNIVERFKEEIASDEKAVVDFKLNYTINGNTIEFIIKDEQLKIRDYTHTKRISHAEFLRNKDLFLPNHIIGYYSGQSGRFKSIFKEHKENAIQKIIAIRNAQEKRAEQELKAFEEGVEITPADRVLIPEEEFRKLLYTEHNLSQLLLLTLLAFKDRKPAFNKLLKDYLRIDGFNRISFVLKSPDFNKDISIDDNIGEFWGVHGSTLKCCSFLYRIAKRSSQLPKEEVDQIGLEGPVKEAFAILINSQKFIEEAASEFNNSEEETFRCLESLLLSDVLHLIEIEIKREGVEAPITFVNLSEGEQQMIVTIGLMAITERQNSIYLLDEPDTHLNPKWQRQYLNIIQELVDTEDKSHVFISTHSPFILQAVESSELLLIKKDAENRAIYEKINNMHTWKIDQILTSEIFEMETTRAIDIEEAIVRRDELKSLKRGLNEAEQSELKEIEESLEDLGLGQTAEEVMINKRLKRLASIFEKNDGND
jgi:predicted ATPase